MKIKFYKKWKKTQEKFRRIAKIAALRLPLFLAGVFCFSVPSKLWAQEIELLKSESSADSGTAVAAFLQACEAYSLGAWDSAQILLRKAVSYPQNDTEEVLFMLVASEMYAKNYASALSDTERFLNRFPKSRYVPVIKYQRGRALFYTGAYNEAVLALSDFCHENPDHEMYASALFVIGESFYADYGYGEAEKFYTRVVTEFPESEKVPDAKFRLESIKQREREEKLLYLLQQTGEEYLSVREEYEKQIRTSSVSAASDSELRRRLNELQQKNNELENKAGVMQQSLDILQLKQKAKAIEDLLYE